MATLDQIFSNTKLTENGDITYSSTGDNLLDILFMQEYFGQHLDQVRIGNSNRERLFSMFIRDPRFGIGRRDLGRVLMRMSGCEPKDVVKAGRYDDLFSCFDKDKAFGYLAEEIRGGNELAKKWAPRYSSKNLLLARDFAKYLGLNKQQYGKFVKAKTVERCLSSKNTGIIQFEHVPSLAMLKYYNRFYKGQDTSERFAKYLEAVKSGKADIKVSTTNVYDIYRNRTKIDADLFFDKIEKIAINCVPIVDSSGSMLNSNDSYGKAMAIGHYLAKCSTYAPNKVVSFSSCPTLLELGKENELKDQWGGDRIRRQSLAGLKGYNREVASMYTGDCTNTDFGAVMELFKGMTDVPEYLVVLSDMEFDIGSRQSKNELREIWSRNGYKTKIIWWNLNERNTTCPEIDADGNIFMSGYSPMLLKFLESGFDGKKFLDKLLTEYGKAIAE